MRRISAIIGLVFLILGGVLVLIGAANGVNSLKYQMLGQFPSAAVGQMAVGAVIATVGGVTTWWATQPSSDLMVSTHQ